VLLLLLLTLISSPPQPSRLIASRSHRPLLECHFISDECFVGHFGWRSWCRGASRMPTGRKLCPVCNTSHTDREILRHVRDKHPKAILSKDQLDSLSASQCRQCQAVVSATSKGTHTCLPSRSDGASSAQSDRRSYSLVVSEPWIHTTRSWTATEGLPNESDQNPSRVTRTRTQVARIAKSSQSPNS
jgi:hypothetical protein